MKQLDPGLAAHLAGGTTTLARCWRLRRGDAAVFGFTDHDRPLVFDGIVHEPASGFVASEMPASLGLSVDTSEISGALVSPALSEDDLLGGLYDNARVEIFLVNWTTPSERTLLEVGNIGEITRQGSAFKAEVRSLTHRLDQERGRLYASTCDADFADRRCGVDPNAPAYAGSATVTEILGPRSFRVDGPASVQLGFLTRGSLAWTSGGNANRKSEIREDRSDGVSRILDLWNQPARPIEEGDQFRALAGCDKRYETCLFRFGNGVNFRGFPYLPGNDFIAGYASSADNNDGGSLI